MAILQDPPQRGKAQHHHGDPLTQTASKVVTSRHTTERLLLISLCCLFFVLALTLGVLYALGNTLLRGNQATITQLQKRQEELNRTLQGNQETITQLKKIQEELNRTLQEKEINIVQLQTEKKTLQSNVTGNQATITQLKKIQEELNRRFQDKEKEIKKLEAEKQKLSEQLKGDDCCAKGWKYFSGKCYYFSKDKKTWTASRDACVAEGGHLVIASSTEEQDFLNRRILPLNTGHHYYWVGLTDAVTEGDWHWLDGTSLSAKSRMWSSGQPDNWKGPRDKQGENCAAMAPSSTSYGLFDKFCDDSFYRICEAKTQIK
ncbi:CD209 antigen-like protein E isoform X2 [Hoplias malabaricus]|uniref:CD209 antigen-like protein E isoform X2 n=1 Tax=Hoplias malabaricus TaxID=27720 RepID=UPI003462B759